MNKITIFFILILIVIAGMLGLWYLTNRNFSQQILTLQITGPQSANAGDEIIYVVTYQNNSKYVLQSPQLVFNLPDNSLTEDSQTRVAQNLKNIQPGEKDVVQFKTRLLGKEGDVKTASARFSYIPQNLSVRYESDTTFSTTISTVPMTLSFNVPASAKQGQEIICNVNYFSNIDYPLENMSIKVDLASGFTVESAIPFSLDNIEWKLPVLQKGDGDKIVIKGLVAPDATVLHFSAHLGMWQDGVFVVVKDVSQDVAVGQ